MKINKLTDEYLNSIKFYNGCYIVDDNMEFSDNLDFSKYKFKFGDDTKFGNRTKFGDGTKFGYWTIFGNWTEFGDDTVFGYGTEFGNWTKFGNGTEFVGIVTDHIYTLSNIDGSGRQVNIAKCSKTGIIKIEAGCFVGTDKEFIDKSNSENKNDYVNLVGAFCESLRRK